jgi:hypothetical protein
VERAAADAARARSELLGKPINLATRTRVAAFLEDGGA